METTCVEMEIPVAMKPYISTKPDEILIQRALLLYPFIRNLTISHGRAAEILGISKWQLIELYSKEGIPYISLSWSEVEEDASNCLSVMKKTGR